MIKAIVLDMDGTIINSDDLVLKIYDDIKKSEQDGQLLENISRNDLLQKSNIEIFNHLYPKNSSFYINLYEKLHQTYVKDYLHIYPDTIPFLDFCKEREIELFLFTSEIKSITNFETKSLKIDHYFKEMMTFDDVTHAKPHGEGLFKIMDKYHYKNHEMIFIGDSVNDGLAGKHAKVDTIYMNRHHTEPLHTFDHHSNSLVDVKDYLLNNLPLIKIEVSNDDYNIMQLTDLHLDGSVNDQKTFELIRRMVYAESPDYIVLTGDQTMGQNSPKHYQILMDLMDSFKIPYSFVFGNHDSEHESYEDILSHIKHAKNLIFHKNDLKLGYGNYFIELRKNDQTSMLLFFLDSHSYQDYIIDGNKTWGYGEINQDQIKWYETITSSYKESIPNLIFTHIPTYTFREKDYYPFIGVAHEDVCSAPMDNHIHEVFKKNGVKGVFVGHDHYNDYQFVKDDILYAYGRVTGFYDYKDIPMVRGSRMIKITNQNIDSYIITH